MCRTARANAGIARAASSSSSRVSMKIDGRDRRSRGSVDRHTAHSHPIIGTPCEVPLPSSVILRLNDPFAGARRLDEAQAELVEDLFENLAFFSSQVAPRFLIEQREDR